MKEEFKLVSLSHDSPGCDLSFLSKDSAQAIRAFHQSFPMYTPTPLARLSETAKLLGLGDVYVKDESYRFGLNAFKVLGGSYSIGNYIAKSLGLDISDLSYEMLTSPEMRQKLAGTTFVTATDGNHGRGVAWTANTLG